MSDPTTLLNQAALAVQAGFGAVWVSDHFHPWFHTEARESNAWVWLSTALERIKNIPFGTAITSPILRYHPGLVAQVFATMEAMHGNRVILGVGTGEAMNEVPLGFQWPSLAVRRAMLEESIQLIRKLWQEEFVDFRGQFFTLNKANLYMKSKVPIFVSGFGPKMARIAGARGDGFITGMKPNEYIRNVLFPALDEGAKAVGKSLDDIVKTVEIDLAYDEDYGKALATVRKWSGGAVPNIFSKAISDPREIEDLGKSVTDKELSETYLIATSPEDCIRTIEQSFESGFDHVYIASSSPDEEKTIATYREKVLPYFNAENTRGRPNVHKNRR